MNQAVRDLWSGFAVESVPEAAMTYDLISEGDGFRFKASPEDNFPPGNPWNQLDGLRGHITYQALQGSPELLALHAAVLAKNGQTLLLVGESYSGKTTLLVDLLTSGWAYIGDDLAPLTDQGRLLAFPKPISLRDLVRWRELASGWGPAEKLTPPLFVGLLPGNRFELIADSVPPPSWILFPGFQKGTAPKIEALPPALAAARCLMNSHKPDGDSRVSIGTFGRLCESASAWEIEYGSSTDALSLVAQILDS